MTETTQNPTNEDLINQMYDASLAGQKVQLEQNRDQGLANLEQEQKKLQQQTDANLNRTYVEAARDQRNYNEVQNAYGLASGAMAQARLAQDNQLEADLTALRGAQAQVDANIERERTMLSQQYMAAIAQAQAENDLKRAQALYDQARKDEAQLLENQKEAGKLMASVGDYSILANLYGLTPEQLAKLQPSQSSGGSTPGKGFANWDEYLAYLDGLGQEPPQTTTDVPPVTNALTPDQIYKTALAGAKDNNDPQAGYIQLWAAAQDGLITSEQMALYSNRLTTEWRK